MACLPLSKHLNVDLSDVRPINSPSRITGLFLPLITVILLAACSPLTLLNALSPDSNAQVTHDVAYGPLARHQLDIYAPKDHVKPSPVVVFFYGGNWNSGNRADYAFVGHALATRGIVAVVADYRLYPQVRYPGFLEDAALATAWAARNVQRFGGDPRRLFVMGHSAGAYNAAMVALDRRWLAAQDLDPGILKGWIGLGGPYDFLPITNPHVKPVFFHPDTPPDSQPIRHVSSDAPPALLIAAESDTVVNPKRNTGGLVEHLRQNHVPVIEAYYDHVNHATLVATLSTSLRHLAPTLEAVDHFVHSNGKTIKDPVLTAK
jgi:acetyl esterase/lipase